MIEIHPDQRCECPKARGSGRFYLGREVCRLCSGFIILTAAEMRELRQAELRASVRQRGVWPAGTAPVLAARDVRRIVGEMLQADPDITNEAMRDRISFYGTYP